MKKIAIIIALAVLFAVIPKPKEQKVAATPTIRYIRTGKASWYSRKSPGIKHHTASMEPFNDQAMTCAMWGVSFGRKIRVTNLENGKSVIVRVNDRGPHARYVRQGRIIDLTKGAFEKIASPKRGLITVQIEFL